MCKGNLDGIERELNHMENVKFKIKKQYSRIKYFVMDVDGTLTDGKIYMSDNGEFYKVFNVKDGFGIKDILIPIGIEPIVVTARITDIVLRRCKEIGIEKIYMGVKYKENIIRELVTDFSCVAYIGDDVNDIPCMKDVKKAGGVVACPKNAVKKVIEIADYISEHDGGEGAVRDFIDWLIEY